MNLANALTFFCIVLGISFIFYNDLVGMFAFINLGISIALLESVENEGLNLLSFVNQQGTLSAKVIFTWITLLAFIIMFSYKALKDRRNHL